MTNVSLVVLLCSGDRSSVVSKQVVLWLDPNLLTTWNDTAFDIVWHMGDSQDNSEKRHRARLPRLRGPYHVRPVYKQPWPATPAKSWITYVELGWSVGWLYVVKLMNIFRRWAIVYCCKTRIQVTLQEDKDIPNLRIHKSPPSLPLVFRFAVVYFFNHQNATNAGWHVIGYSSFVQQRKKLIQHLEWCALPDRWCYAALYTFSPVTDFFLTQTRGTYCKLNCGHILLCEEREGKEVFGPLTAPSGNFNTND